MRIHIHRPGGIGDGLLLVPALRALRADYPAATIAGYGRIEAMRWLKRAGLIDVAAPETADLAGCDILVGFSYTPNRWRQEHFSVAPIVTSCPYLHPAGTHMARHQYDQVKRALPVWSPYDPSPVRFPVRRPVRARFAGAVVLAPGASFRAKCWPGFRELAERLREAGRRVVFSEPCPEDSGFETVERPFLQVAEILAAAALVIGNDSAPCHAAALAGTLTIALFGPTLPAHWSPIGALATSLHGCPTLSDRSDTNAVIACEKGDCWDLLPVEDVLDAVRVMLARIAA